ncbi:MAG TPA: DUF1735 domain-containing protein [Chitinophagaceae bacterium]|nr:DUF1735 domain-containing protein [Chitinophagaceae bacterium]
MKLKLFVTILSSAVLLSSCLKSTDPYGINNDPGSIVTEISDDSYYGPGNGAIKVVGLNGLPATETVTAITLKYYAARALKPGNPIHVKLVVNNPATMAIISGAGLTVMPANTYTLSTLEFDIPKGAVDGQIAVPITFNKSNFNFSLAYGLGISISSVSEGVISSLATDIVLSYQIKNAYEADYMTTGYFFHPSAPRVLGPGIKHMFTRGSVRSEAQLGDLGGFNFQFDVSGTNTCINWAPVGSMPAPSNGGGSSFMTADNPGNVDYSAAAPNNAGVAPWLQSSYNNTYDPGTQTFWMHYGYIASIPGGTQNSFTRQVYEKWVRQ